MHTSIIIEHIHGVGIKLNFFGLYDVLPVSQKSVFEPIHPDFPLWIEILRINIAPQSVLEKPCRDALSRKIQPADKKTPLADLNLKER